MILLAFVLGDQLRVNGDGATVISVVDVVEIVDGDFQPQSGD